MEGENVIGYIDNMTSFGIIAARRRSIIVTNKRTFILDANSASSIAVSAGFAYVFGAFGRKMANKVSKKEVEETTRKLAESNLDSLVGENADNIVLNNSDVESVAINRKQVAIRTGGKTFKYKLANPEVRKKKLDTYERYVQILTTAFGNRLNAKGIMVPGNSNMKTCANPAWVAISAIPLMIGTVVAVLHTLTLKNENKAYSLLLLIPFIGPIITYVLMSSKDRYLSTLAEWVFVGQILGAVIFTLIANFV